MTIKLRLDGDCYWIVVTFQSGLCPLVKCLGAITRREAMAKYVKFVEAAQRCASEAENKVEAARRAVEQAFA